MRSYDVAMIVFGLSLLLTPVLVLTLVRKASRRRAWPALKVSLATLVVSLGVALATSPPKDVLEAEAAARAARAQQSARETAEKETAAASATQQVETDRVSKEAIAASARAAASAEAAEVKLQAERTTTVEAQIDWSNRLWALSALSTSYVRNGDLSGLSEARYKAGELFIEAFGWEKADAKLAHLCSQAADALKNAIIAAREGNMSGGPDSYATQVKRRDSYHDQCSTTAREMRGDAPLKKARTAG